MIKAGSIVVLFAILLALVPQALAADPPAAAPTYTQVHAIFAKNCLSCHDAKEAEGGLILESHTTLSKGGDTGPAIVPGKSADSLLLRLIEHREKPFMPPPKKGMKLSDAEIALIKAWIDGGALNTTGAPLPTLTPTPKIPVKTPPAPAVYSLEYAHPHKLLAVARYGVVELQSPESRATLRKLEGHRGNINDLAISADGRLLAAAAGEPGQTGQILIWELPTGGRLHSLEGHKDAVYAVALSPDGKILASGSYDQKIMLWDLQTGKTLRELEGHNGSVTGLAFRKDGKVLASSSADRTVKLWDVATGNRLDTFSEPAKELMTVAFSPDGTRVAAGGADNRIRVWRVSEKAVEGSNAILHSSFAHDGTILRLKFSADGKFILSSADDRTVKIWEADSMNLKLALPAQPDWPSALAFALGDKAIAVGRLDGSLAYFEAASGKLLPPPKPEAIALQPRGLQRGQTITAIIAGKHLTSATGVKSSDPKITTQILPEQTKSDSLALKITAAADLPPGAYDITLASLAGDTAPLKIHIDDLPQLVENQNNDLPSTATPAQLPVSLWGRFEKRADADHFAFDAKAGQNLVFDVAARRLGSKANVVLALLDPTGRLLASANDFDDDIDPLLSFTIPADGRYILRVTEHMATTSGEHFYRLSAGPFAYVTAVHPMGVAPGAEATITLAGFNLPQAASIKITAPKEGELSVPLGPSTYRARKSHKVIVSPVADVLESEPNDEPASATKLSVPSFASARIHRAAADARPDVDFYSFPARKGDTLVIETLAARRGSPLDTKIEILHADGKPVERVRLRAVRDSYLTFRPIDADQGGARLWNWEEMDLNQYLYMNGEVVRLFLAPRGPDSEFNFYTLFGKRRNYFDTSATAHALDEKCYIVEPLPPGATPQPNGLPVFPVYYVNDDDALRQLGRDSRLLFTPPADGTYLVRVTDTRSASGDRFTYRLEIRPAKPDFDVVIEGGNPSVPPGTGRPFTVRIDRIDGFEGEVKVDIAGAPPGFTISSPIVVQSGHTTARGTIYAAPDAPRPTAENAGQTKVIATAMLNGQPMTKGGDNNLGTISLGTAKPPLRVWLEPLAASSDVSRQLTVEPGREVQARLRIERNGHDGPVTFELDNLPHGVIVADIGLNGVLIPEKQTERNIFISCAPWVPDASRPIHAQAKEAGNPTSAPLTFHVKRPQTQAQR